MNPKHIAAKLLEDGEDIDPKAWVMRQPTGSLRKYTFADHELRKVQELLLPNAYGQNRTVRIYRNGFDRYTWRILYQDNPVIANVEHAYTYNYYDSAKAALRAARRFMSTLAQ